MSKTNDDLMYELLKAKRDGEKIYYSPYNGDRTSLPVTGDHRWDLNGNEYKIKRRREFIIRIDDKHPNNPVIEEVQNNWTRSDFGRVENCEHILMREVYQEEM